MAVPIRAGAYSIRMNEAAKTTVLGHFPYGVYAVTVKHAGEEHGMTVNWVAQTSFEPPMVAVAVENTSKTIELIRDARHFAINVFLQGQGELAAELGDRKSTRLNSSHVSISYAVFCLKKKKKK